MTAPQKRMMFVMDTLSIFGDWGQDCFRAILHIFWNGCTFNLRQLIDCESAMLEICCEVRGGGG